MSNRSQWDDYPVRSVTGTFTAGSTNALSVPAGKKAVIEHVTLSSDGSTVSGPFRIANSGDTVTYARLYSAATVPNYLNGPFVLADGEDVYIYHSDATNKKLYTMTYREVPADV